MQCRWSVLIMLATLAPIGGGHIGSSPSVASVVVRGIHDVRIMDRGLEERPVAGRTVPPSDRELARKDKVFEPPFGVDVAAERDVAEFLLSVVAPAHDLHGAECSGAADAQPDLGSFGWHVEARDDEVVALSSPAHAVVG